MSNQPMAASINERLADSDTPLTDALVDQFASYYLLAVLAVKALEALREQKRRSVSLD